MYDRNISGSFNNQSGLGSSYTQHNAGVNSWDSFTSAQTKIAVENIQKYGVLPAKAVPKKKSLLYRGIYALAFKVGKLFK